MSCAHQWDGDHVLVDTPTCSCCGVAQIDLSLVSIEVPRSLLQDSLRRYGAHQTGCDSVWGQQCTCGFEQVMRLCCPL